MTPNPQITQLSILTTPNQPPFQEESPVRTYHPFPPSSDPSISGTTSQGAIAITVDELGRVYLIGREDLEI